MTPGKYIIRDEPVLANASKRCASIRVANAGDRPVQVGSHTHFFEVNGALSFDREAAYGMHLNIPAGISVRFEPGDARTVELVEYGGDGTVWGFRGMVNGSLKENRSRALEGMS